MNQLQGPPADPGSEKRILLAFVLTFVVIALMQPLISRYMKPPAPPEQKTQAQTAAQSSPAAPAASTSAATPAQVGAARASSPASAATKQASAETETVIDTDLYRITFTNKGAQVKSWILKKYDDDHGKPLELVHSIAAPKYGYPLSFWTWDQIVKDKLNSAMYVADKSGTLHVPVTLSFEYADGETTVHKTFSFDETYVVRVETSVIQKGAPYTALIAWPSGFGDDTVPSSYAASMVDYQHLDNVERVNVKKISGGNTIKGPFQWAAATDQYFAAAFLPDEPQSAMLVTLANSVDIPRNLDKPDPNEKPIQVPVVGIAAGNGSGVTAGRFFVGPKALKVIDAIHATPVNGVAPDLDKLVDFGRWFGWLARPLFLWLEWTQQHWIKNWGWDIVILTIVITVAVMPLRVSSMKSALKMQKFQPQMKAIQNKYKQKMAGMKMGDPKRQELMQQQNTELGTLYKEHGINPAGGCVPLLLQMPFLIAFYSMLGVTIELRHAHWLWITDLSSPDPWHILPIFIIVSMFYLQSLTPQAGMDPVQQKMMQIMMPVMFGIMSWNLSSGLGVYWVFSQLLAVAQQHWINNTSFGREMREAMNKRAQKK